MGEKSRASLITLIISLANTGVVMLFNLIYTNVVINRYGSDVNGLISTLTQFVNLFMVFEGGFTIAAVVAIYDPVVKKDYEKIDDILYTTQKTFSRIGFWVALIVAIIGSIYIRYIDSPYSYKETFLLLIVFIFSTFSSFIFLTKYVVLIQGINKEYIQVAISFLSRSLVWIFSIILMMKRVNILAICSLNILCLFVNIFLIHIYVKKRCTFVTFKGAYRKDYIKGTNHTFFQKIASTIFTSTDLVLISAILGLRFASVYNLYNQIFSAIFGILAAVCQAPFNSFGLFFNEKKETKETCRLFEIYQYLVLVFSSIVLSISGVAITPFVRLYTRGVADQEYVYPILAYLFFSQFFLQITNRPYGGILNIAGLFHLQNWQCGIAAILNLVVSYLMINRCGIAGVIFGSAISTLVIMGANIYFVHRRVFNTSLKKDWMIICSNYLLGIVIIGISIRMDIICNSYWEMFLYVIIQSICICMIFLPANFILDPSRFKEMIKYIISIVVNKPYESE